MMYVLIANILLILHFLFIFFVVGGQAMMMLGYHLRWSWVRKRWIRLVHISCVVYVVIQTWTWRHCPLTLIENRFRLAAGQDPYEGSFIAHWLSRIVYVDAPQYVSMVIYTVFGLLAILYWYLNSRREPIPGTCTR